jgi:hypothetical protein
MSLRYGVKDLCGCTPARKHWIVPPRANLSAMYSAASLERFRH